MCQPFRLANVTENSFPTERKFQNANGLVAFFQVLPFSPHSPHEACALLASSAAASSRAALAGRCASAVGVCESIGQKRPTLSHTHRLCRSYFGCPRDICVRKYSIIWLSVQYKHDYHSLASDKRPHKFCPQNDNSMADRH